MSAASAPRFNRHVPALCADCRRPLSVRERRASEGDMVCAWDAYKRYREQFEQVAVGGGWISEVDTIVTTDGETVVLSIDPFDLFGIAREEGDDPD